MIQVGIIVTHKDEPVMRGEIVRLFDGEEIDRECKGEPWCEIRWSVVPEGENPYLGREHVDQLIEIE